MKNNYNCFSFNQMKYLNARGQKPIHVMMHQETGNTFWIFKKSEELDKLLKMWTYKGKHKELISA